MAYEKPLIGTNLVIVDQNNVPRIEAGCLRDGSPIFSLKDSENRVRIAIGVTDEVGPIVTLVDPNNVRRLQIACAPDRGPEITLSGPEADEGVRLHIRVKNDGDACVITFLGREETQASLNLGVVIDHPVIEGTDKSGVKSFQAL